MTTTTDIQALIDSKVALIASIITQIGDMIANPKPSYSCDGQSVDWTTYQRYLIDAQKTEIECLDMLYDLQNRIQPYYFQSRGR